MPGLVKGVTLPQSELRPGLSVSLDPKEGVESLRILPYTKRSTAGVKLSRVFFAMQSSGQVVSVPDLRTCEGLVPRLVVMQAAKMMVKIS